MKRLLPMLALVMIATLGSHALASSSSEGTSPGDIFHHSTSSRLESDSSALLLAQGPRGPGDGPRDFRGPERYPHPGPRGPGPSDPDFWYGPGPGPAPRPAPPPPDPGPAGIIPHVLPLLLPPPRP